MKYLVQGATLVTLGFNYIGASGALNIWHPSVGSQDDYTTAQIWLKHGPEYVESGWMVRSIIYPKLLIPAYRFIKLILNLFVL